MTPKEKAKQLVEKYISASVVVEYGKEYYHSKPFSLAKQCALIAVDEILQAIIETESYLNSDSQTSEYKYWEQVKQEINNL